MRSIHCLIAAAACAAAFAHAAAPLPRLRVDGDAIVDESNRAVLLRGVNLGRKNAPYLPAFGEDDYAAIARWGFNCVRLYFNWAGLEPEPGMHDAAFLEGLAQQVALANAHGLYVMLDIHQDLYGARIPGGNGAPAWATLDDGAPHIMPGGSWGVAYFTSPQVHRAFDSFWANRPGPGGIGLQDRFAAAAQTLARRFAEVAGVVGIDLYNEPGLGSAVTQTLPALTQAAPALMALPDPPRGVLAGLLSNEAPAFLEQLTRRRDIYLWMVDAIGPVLNDFERTQLQPFYDRAGRAVRAVSPHPILFFEPPVLANSGARSALRPMQDAAGAPLPNQAYAAHAYDLVTDSDHVDDPSAARLEIMFERLGDHARSMGLPAVVGEWGAYYGRHDARPAAQLAVASLEQHRLGDLYWDYSPELERKPFFDQLCRPYPQAVAGRLGLWQFDQAARVLRIEWREPAGATAPTRLFLPRAWYAERPAIAVQPPGGVEWHEAPGQGGWLADIAPVRSEAARHAVVIPAAGPEVH